MRHQGGNAHRLLRRGLLDGINFAPVLIGPGVVYEQVAHRLQPQLFQGLGPLGADAGEGVQPGIQGHICSLPSGKRFIKL